jgi:hypothetical protein
MKIQSTLSLPVYLRSMFILYIPLHLGHIYVGKKFKCNEYFRENSHVFFFLALLLLYDVTNKTSFDNIRAWLGEIREYAQDDVVIMLLGK